MFSKKHDIDFPQDVIQKNCSRLTNQVWKLIPMKEKDEDWKRQLETVIIEVIGLHEIFMSGQYLQLLSKLEGLKETADDIDFDLYRKTVFETISILQGMSKNALE